MKNTQIIVVTFLILIFTSCVGDDQAKSESAAHRDSILEKDSTLKCCESNIPSRFGDLNKIKNDSTHTENFKSKSHEGMLWIEGGAFMMGADNEQASRDEYPKHKVTVNGFWMDETEVTNDQFEKFIKATGYITTAEKDVDWNELKKQVEPGTPKPPDSMLRASSLVFKPMRKAGEINLNNSRQWWEWKQGADWKHPEGPNSTIKGKGNYPVVHVSWEDAIAYCKWANKRLPTEAEWEYASRGGLVNTIYSWGNENVDAGKPKCNYWQGIFPLKNEIKDGHYKSAPVRSFPPNAYGLYDMAGNVWEWCYDWYRNDYYTQINNSQGIKDPKGPLQSFDPAEPYSPKRVTRGGSFLCNESYCSGYRCARRMKSSPDTGMEHLGFRCVSDKL